MPSFASETSLSEKINYNIKKLEKGLANFLYDNSHVNDIYQLFSEMKNVGSLNDRVSKKYSEIIISFPPGEKIDNEKFKKIAKEYMLKMGYDESCYHIWRHLDKEHEHVHIYLTTVGYDGKWINDSNSRIRSQKLSRELEEKYDLKEVVYDKFSNEPLSQIKAREYYFNNALKKGLRAYNSKAQLEKILSGGGYIELLKRKDFSNKELEKLLGADLYQEVGDILEKNKLFNKLYKDELLGMLDVIYDVATSKEDFFKRLEDVGLYIRMVSQKGEHAYVYGIKDVNVYFTDKQLPLTYRYENISAFGKREPKILIESEQKNRIRNKVFIALEKASSFQEFTKESEKLNVTLIPHKNEKGIYGVSFQLNGISKPVMFKGSEISRRFSYRNLENYFEGKNKPLEVLVKNSPGFIEELRRVENVYEGKNRPLEVLVKDSPVSIEELRRVEDVYGEGIPLMNQHNDQEEDFLMNKKKKKRKGKDKQQTI